jgi:hypothetical protein
MHILHKCPVILLMKYYLPLRENTCYYIYCLLLTTKCSYLAILIITCSFYVNRKYSGNLSLYFNEQNYAINWRIVFNKSIHLTIKRQSGTCIKLIFPWQLALKKQSDSPYNTSLLYPFNNVTRFVTETIKFIQIFIVIYIPFVLLK